MTPVILGHRGASAHAPENSLAAFERAMADGADGVELDVRLCKTGEVVVFHDEDLRRLAGQSERIATLAWSDLRERTLASGARVPLLTDVLAVLGSARLINVEMKLDRAPDLDGDRLVTEVKRVLERAGADVATKVVVSSFSAAAVRAFRRVCPQIAIGYLFEEGLFWNLRANRTARALRVTAVHPRHGLCDASRVAAWHARGYRVNVWTVDDPDRVRALAAMGVDSIIANDPAAARAALQNAR
jgi:glycerophosphoryl diester phosphodiesterase